MMVDDPLSPLLPASVSTDSHWLGKAQDHLYQHMQIFASMTGNPEHQIRQALLGLCQTLQKQSWKALKNTRPVQVGQ